MSSTRIAIVGIGLCYPDAGSPRELWENVLAGRRAFRRLPDERMNHADYYSPDPAAPDRFYSAKAAVLRDFEFDRARYKVSGGTYRATDLTHWLALDVAAQALTDAGYADGEGLPRQSTGVVLGNSLTGEFSRANIMRLRWPYVRRTLAAALAEKGWTPEESGEFLREFETRYKEPFPPINEDSLAGGLANTIAGRICNHFDLGGGGYTVDGACSSSLLSVATAAKALEDGDLDVVLAGGVDLSIDPFEVIGFAKTGALAKSEMKVYSKDSNGFWPGEGSGQLVLMRESDAIEQGKRIYATITGWGVSSDGKGGITRPEADGHRLALSRAYRRAGYGLESVSYFEGHGTGTALGDATEIDALSSARRDAGPSARPAALSTVKGNLGHTKAAAGVAGLIKASLAVYHQVIPPGTGFGEPHPKLLDDSAALYLPRSPELWPTSEPVRAGVSAMGFGGINTHIAVEEPRGVTRRAELDGWTANAAAGRQDAEVWLFDAADTAELRERIARAAAVAGKLAFAELADVAAVLAGELTGAVVRAAVVAANPEEAEKRLAGLLDRIDAGEATVFEPGEGLFLDQSARPPAIAFLFPGQGSGKGTAGALRRRFEEADEPFVTVGLSGNGDQVATQVAQPRIVAGAVGALEVLRRLGIEGAVAAGHSLGELSALHWGGALDTAQVLRLAAVRGEVMAAASRGGGTMAGLATGPDDAARLAEGEDVVIAGFNGPSQTVLSGAVAAIERVCARAAAAGVTATRIAVSHAFHSPLVAPAAEAMTERLAEFDFAPLTGRVISTVTGTALTAGTDLRALLREQVLAPVRFHQAAAEAAGQADLVLELGPGRVLGGLLAEIAPDKPVLSLDTDNPSLVPLLRIVAAAFTAGAPVDAEALFEGRVVRPFPLDGGFTFLASPCEEAPESSIGQTMLPEEAPAETAVLASGIGQSTLDLLCKLVADRLELPPDVVGPDTHPLDDLHLSSITVGQLINDVTRELGRPALAATTNFATVSIGELAKMIDELAATAQADESPDNAEPPGVATWVRAFSVGEVAEPVPAADDATSAAPGSWTVHTVAGHPLAEPVRGALEASAVGEGVLLCLPTECDESHSGLFLEAARAALAASAGSRFAVVQHGLGADGLARTLFLESGTTPTTVITFDDPAIAGEAAAALVATEVAATTEYTAVRYAVDGTRTVPALTAMPPDRAGPSPLDATDVVLATGGGKGITAECALAIAMDSGARLALFGRAAVHEDTELAANLSRMDAAGVEYQYEQVDVTSAAEVAAGVARIKAGLGAVTAVLHGAGRNMPAAIGSLTPEEFSATLAPKVSGLRNVLAAVDQDRLKLLLTFGSVIGRAGLRGEAHYATANDWMSELTVRFQREHPRARALALEWSVWSGAGMGERLGVVEALMRDGITPISTEEGIAVLRQVLGDPSAGPVLVVSGRLGGQPTLNLPRPELPLRRFTDRVLVHYPDVELVTEADLSAGSDPYLADHLLDGDYLFPAVLGMEAMAQVGAAAVGHRSSPLLENAEFLRPIVVRPGGVTTVRFAALVRDASTVEVVIRSAETGFSADHFRATLRYPRPRLVAVVDGAEPDLPLVPVEPVSDLYGGVLFQGKRFQRLQAYRRVGARRAVAEVSTSTTSAWFAPFLPQELVLADPGTRDTMMHALQCCVPDATLLPERVDRLHLSEVEDQNTPYVVLDARERSQDGDSYIYDIDVRDQVGILVERWEGLKLRAVRKRDGAGPWVPSLLGPYLERSLEDVLGGGRTVVVEPDPVRTDAGPPAERRAQTKLAVSRALGRPVQVRYRPDGRPETDGAVISASHTAGLTMAVVGEGRLGCDIETVLSRAEADWAGLLGPDGVAVRDLLCSVSADDVAVAGTRVWSALECVRKAGSAGQALTVDRVLPQGWTVLSAGDTRIATWVTTISGVVEPVVFAVLVGKEW
ncbi:SDR family NAD(P)-dependent oxidoreductase [Amycolatopsis sp. cmx-11-51]|uniref:type I polyketide synthase n=1 Tax=Amycolatopsis sp. cmx-11-51 TaxID=2785797 RepID=UPI0039E62FA3